MSDHEHHGRQQEAWDESAQRRSQSGFAINSWGNLMSFLSVCLMAIAGITWGLKLESRIDKYADLQSSMREQFLADIATTQAILSRGMLPVTEAKINAMENRMDKLEADIDICLRRSKASLPMADRVP